MAPGGEERQGGGWLPPVLLSSERSEFTDPALPEFRGTGLDVRHLPVPEGRRYATVRPAGREGPVLELRQVRGQWKLDGLAAERVSFVAAAWTRAGPAATAGASSTGWPRAAPPAGTT